MALAISSKLTDPLASLVLVNALNPAGNCQHAPSRIVGVLVHRRSSQVACASAIEPIAVDMVDDLHLVFVAHPRSFSDEAMQARMASQFLV